MANPAMRQRGQKIQLRLFDGTVETTRGTVRLAETTAGEASLAFGDKGPVAWIDRDGDPDEIEFAEFTAPAESRRRRHRVTKRERVGTILPVIKLHLTGEGELTGPDFLAGDWNSTDWMTGA